MPDSLAVAAIGALGVFGGAVLTFMVGLKRAGTEESSAISRTAIDLSEMVMSHVKSELVTLRSANESLKIRAKELRDENEGLRIRVSALEMSIENLQGTIEQLKHSSP